jgi:hypothetical protein
MVIKETIYVYAENHMKPINTLCEQNGEKLFNIKSGAHGGGERCIQHFGWEAWREENTGKT